MAKTYTIEVVKESRALETVTAETLAEAQEEINRRNLNNEIQWKMVDHIITDVIDTRQAK